MKALLILAALLLAACGGGGYEAQAAPARPLFVAIGDSITAAYMPGSGARNRLAPELAYTAELRALGEVVTAAVGGSTTEAAAVNQVYWLAPLRPDVVTILLGTNDAVYSLSRPTALQNVIRIAEAWPGARVVLISPPRWSIKTDPWMTAWSRDLQQLATSRGWQFVDAYAASTAENWQCSTEDFHPCEPAHRKLGRMVSDAAKRALGRN